MKTNRSHQLPADVICLLYIILFTYTSMAKLIAYPAARLQWAQSPFITEMAGVLIWLIPAAELLIVVLLAFRKTRLPGLYGALGLMCLFSAYIYAMLHVSYYVPCSCGGVLSAMSWTQHFWFNIVFATLAITGIAWQQRPLTWHWLLAALLTGPAIVVVLAWHTQWQEAGEVQVLRRQGPVLIQKVVIHNNEAYGQLAGMDSNYLYYTAQQPGLLWKAAYKSGSSSARQAPLPHLPDALSHYSYQTDAWGLLVLNRHAGILYGSQAGTGYVRYQPGITFSQAVRSSASTCLIRGYLPGRGGDPFFYRYTPGLGITAREQGLTERTGDFGLSQDGILLYDTATNKAIYVYYYKSRVLFFDTSFRQLQTITTIDHTKEKTFRVAAATQQQGIQYITNATPKKRINGMAAVANGHLWIKPVMPATGDTADVYSTASGLYIYSVAIPRYGQERVAGFCVSDHQLLAMYPHAMVVYEWKQ